MPTSFLWPSNWGFCAFSRKTLFLLACGTSFLTSCKPAQSNSIKADLANPPPVSVNSPGDQEALTLVQTNCGGAQCHAQFLGQPKSDLELKNWVTLGLQKGMPLGKILDAPVRSIIVNWAAPSTSPNPGAATLPLPTLNPAVGIVNPANPIFGTSGGIPGSNQGITNRGDEDDEEDDEDDEDDDEDEDFDDDGGADDGSDDGE